MALSLRKSQSIHKFKCGANDLEKVKVWKLYFVNQDKCISPFALGNCKRLF